jgi:anthranilate/para-aminobenzoate synthase component I
MAGFPPRNSVGNCPQNQPPASQRSPELRSEGGAVGYLDFAGNLDTCIALRTIVWKNGIFDIQAGAGVVADSVPSAEYDETMNKAKAMLKAVEISQNGF